MENGEYISTTETAELVGVTRQAVLERISKGKLGAFMIGEQYIIRKTDAESWKLSRI